MGQITTLGTGEQWNEVLPGNGNYLQGGIKYVSSCGHSGGISRTNLITGEFNAGEPGKKRK